jgi:hypothetical protein
MTHEHPGKEEEFEERKELMTAIAKLINGHQAESAKEKEKQEQLEAKGKRMVEASLRRLGKKELQYSEAGILVYHSACCLTFIQRTTAIPSHQPSRLPSNLSASGQTHRPSLSS